MSTLVPALLLGSTAALLLAQAEPGVGRHPVVEKVKVGDLAIVVFSPPESSVPEARDDHGFIEMRYHVGNALAIAAECLEPHGVDAVLVEADVIELESGSRDWRLDAASDGNQGVGAYLIKPGAPPHLVRCASGPSALQVVLPAFGSRYLGHPECVPEEWRGVEISDAC